MSQQQTFRSQAPPPLQPHPIAIPAPRETVLSNGLTVVVVEDRRLPLVSYRLAFRVGGSFDPPDLPGLTDLLAGLLPEGTESRTSREIADEVVCLSTPEPFRAVGLWYEDFSQTSDDEVRQLLAAVPLQRRLDRSA